MTIVVAEGAYLRAYLANQILVDCVPRVLTWGPSEIGVLVARFAPLWHPAHIVVAYARGEPTWVAEGFNWLAGAGRPATSAETPR